MLKPPRPGTGTNPGDVTGDHHLHPGEGQGPQTVPRSGTVRGGAFANLAGEDRSMLIGGHAARLVGGDDAFLCGGDEAIIAGGKRAHVVGGDLSILTAGNDSVVSGKDMSTVTGGIGSTLYGGHRSTIVGGSMATLIGGTWSKVYGGDGAKVSGGNGSVMEVRWYNKENRTYENVTINVGDGGVSPNTLYELDNHGRVTVVRKLSKQEAPHQVNADMREVCTSNDDEREEKDR